MAEQRVKFTELTAEQFPLSIVLAERGTTEVLWSASFAEPGAIQIPGFGREVDCLMVYGDGDYHHTPMSAEQLDALRNTAESIRASREAVNG